MWKLFQVTKTLTKNEDWRPPEVDFGPFRDLFAAKNGRFLGWRFFGHIQQSTQVKIQLKIRSKTGSKTQTTTTITFRSFVRQFIVHCYCCHQNIVIERGALQYVIKPFLYCDLFKASARAEKEKLRTRIVQRISINVYINFNLQSSTSSKNWVLQFWFIC